MNNGQVPTTGDKHCGMIAIVGRPNVGKSTLLNHLLGQKLCITSRKPQTTRHLILGVKTEGNVQMIFVDTPGIHRGGRHAMNQRMNRAASSVVHDVDAVLWVVDRAIWTEEDQQVLDRLASIEQPVVLAINKVDQMADKAALLPLIRKYSAMREFAAIVPLSALQKTGLDELEKALLPHLPSSDFIYPKTSSLTRVSASLLQRLSARKLSGSWVKNCRTRPLSRSSSSSRREVCCALPA